MRVLVVDDERIQRDSLGALLEEQGMSVELASDVKTATSLLFANAYDVVITDFKMTDGTGLDAAKVALQINPSCTVIMMTAYADVQSVIDAMRIGVADYLLKPINVQNLIKKLSLLSERTELQKDIQNLRAQLNKQDNQTLLGSSEPVQAIRQLIEQVAQTKGTILITGESGTGKEVAAREIHNLSQESKKRFVAVNCAAIPENLLESELFGHKKGAFTGAVADKEGLFRVAQGGTLFLDEIGDLPKSLQAKLLRVLQEREMTPVGDTKSIKIDVRLIAATNRDLAKDVEQGIFRQDLFYRINVVQICMPSLRERPSDIPLLAQHFVTKYTRRFHKALVTLSGSACRALAVYEWPGNVRELENVIERAIILNQNKPQIEVSDLPVAIQKPQNEDQNVLDLNRAMELFAKRHIERVLDLCEGDKKKAAKTLGMGLSSLYRRMDELGLKGGGNADGPVV
jgi:DNA-binding NtrC family response regulator